MGRVPAILAVSAIIGLTACARERSRVVSEEETDIVYDGPRDYRGMLDRARERHDETTALEKLQDAVERFQFNLARLPTNLNELAVQRYVDRIPAPPDGHAFVFDPVHGNVSLVPLPDETGVQLPADVTNVAPARIDAIPLPPPP